MALQLALTLNLVTDCIPLTAVIDGMAARQRTCDLFRAPILGCSSSCPSALTAPLPSTPMQALARMRFRYRDAAVMLLGSAHGSAPTSPASRKLHMVMLPSILPTSLEPPAARQRHSNSAAAFLPTARAGTSALHAQRPCKKSPHARSAHLTLPGSRSGLPSSTHLACNHTTSTRQMCCRLLRSEVSTSKP